MLISRNKYDRKRPEVKQDPVNENIRVREVLVIAPDGESLGVMSTHKALNLAQEKYNLDLYLVAPQANPPVAKILNFGKHRFELQKKQKEAKKAQKVVELKEIRLSPVIDTHDLETKARQATKFLQNGDRVKVAVRFRGRQMAHIDVGEKVMEEFIGMIEEFAVVEKKPFMEGRFLNCILASKVKK